MWKPALPRALVEEQDFEKWEEIHSQWKMQKVLGFLSDESLLFFPDTNVNLEEKALLIAGVGVGVAFLPAELFLQFTPVQYHYKFELSLAIALSVEESDAG